MWAGVEYVAFVSDVLFVGIDSVGLCGVCGQKDGVVYSTLGAIHKIRIVDSGEAAGSVHCIKRRLSGGSQLGAFAPAYERKRSARCGRGGIAPRLEATLPPVGFHPSVVVLAAQRRQWRHLEGHVGG